MSGCVGMRLCRIPTQFSGNRMVGLHPPCSKCISIRSAETFFDQRIADIKAGEKPPKMQFWRLLLSIGFFLFLVKTCHFLLGIT